MITTDNIIKDPNPLLRQKSKKVNFPLSQEDQELIRLLYEYVIQSTDPELAEKHNLQPAVGIAAPQIGILKQICAVVVGEYDEEGELIKNNEYVLVNPVILSKSTRQAALREGEGCLSIKEEHPGLVYRSEKIKVRAFDGLTQQMVTFSATGYLSIVIQHEIDHLNGILFYDRINQANPDYEIVNSILI